MANAPVDPKTGRFTKKSDETPVKASFLEPNPPTQDFIQNYNRQMSGLAPAGVAQVETPSGDILARNPRLVDDAIWRVLDRKRSQLRSLELELMKPARVTDPMGNYIGEMPHIKAQREVITREIENLKADISNIESMSPDERREFAGGFITYGRGGLRINV